MFISQKTEKLNEEYSALRDKLSPAEKKLFGDMFDIMHEMAAQIDMLTLKVDELEEQQESTVCKMEDFGSGLQTIRDRIVGEIPVDNPFAENDDDEDEHHHCDCGCEDDDCDCHDNTPVTLQCSYCEEIFITDVHTASKGVVECPFCNRSVIVRDCLVD